MRVSLIILVVAALAVVSGGCRASSLDFFAPPAGLTDDVQVPAELDAEYRLVEGLMGGQSTFYDIVIAGNLNERRAALYVEMNNAAFIRLNWLELASTPCAEGASNELVERIAGEIGAERINSFRWLGRDYHIIGWTEAKSRGELAWYADEILKRNAGDLLFASASIIGIPTVL